MSWYTIAQIKEPIPVYKYNFVGLQQATKGRFIPLFNIIDPSDPKMNSTVVISKNEFSPENVNNYDEAINELAGKDLIWQTDIMPYS